MQIPQIPTMLFQRPRLVPALCNARIVLPRVEEIQVLGILVIEGHHGEVFLEMGDVATVNYGTGSRFRGSHGVVCVDAGSGEFGRLRVG